MKSAAMIGNVLPPNIEALIDAVGRCKHIMRVCKLVMSKYRCCSR